METTPLRASVRDYRATAATTSTSTSTAHAAAAGSAGPAPLPKWFLAAASGSVAVTLAWMGGLVVLQRSPHWHASLLAEEDAATARIGGMANLYLYAGVLNSLLGSFLSASGYCCQKWAHSRVQHAPALGAATQQPMFVAGLVLLAVGTISAVLNLGILGQAVQAPFAALTLIYSALLGRFVLGETLAVSDVGSSVLIVAGVAVDVMAAHWAQVPPQSLTLDSLGALLFRDSLFPAIYAGAALLYMTFLLRRVEAARLQRRATGLLAFSSCAGIMAGFTSLATKSTLEVAKSALAPHSGHALDVVNPFFVILVAAIPAALVPQLFFLNKGLEFFGTLKFIPLYQAFIILGNTLCGMIFYNEMAQYSTRALLLFLTGVAITLTGVCLLLVKVQHQHHGEQATRRAGAHATTATLPTVVAQQQADTAAQEALATQFSFKDMGWAATGVQTLSDFDECQREIVALLNSATESIYYSTFLCDFTQPLLTPTTKPQQQQQQQQNAAPTTFLSCLEAAVKRGVKVHVLCNPVADYGTASLAELRATLPVGVELATSVSDLGPNALTKLLSNNSKYAFHHQKYLCVDARRVMVTGCDVNTERQGWLRANAMGYYWHELSVVAPCSRAMFEWIRANHAASDKKRHYDQFHDSPPFPLVAGGWHEENAMVNMILNASHSVQLENQILITGGNMQHNRIGSALVRRIALAHRAGDDTFRVLILTNAAQQDEPSQVTRLYCTISTQWSMEQLENAALHEGLSLETLYRYVFVARMEHRGVLIKVHSNILITDGYYGLRSSSNLADRSLSARPTDTELGMLFAGHAVVKLQQRLFNMYMSTTNRSYTVDDVIQAARQRRSDCCLIPLEKKTWSPVVTWFLMNVFIYCSEGATGGRAKVTYRTSTTTIVNDGVTYLPIDTTTTATASAKVGVLPTTTSVDSMPQHRDTAITVGGQ